MTYLDTRDLWTELYDLRERNEDAQHPEVDPESVDPLDEDETARLAQLEALADEIGEDTMRNGETLIPVDEFEDYAQELADDIGAIDRNASWPLNHIDWEAAARELSYDYTEVSFDGTDYYVLVN
jgi:hypothetical protein